MTRPIKWLSERQILRNYDGNFYVFRIRRSNAILQVDMKHTHSRFFKTVFKRRLKYESKYNLNKLLAISMSHFCGFNILVMLD